MQLRHLCVRTSIGVNFSERMTDFLFQLPQPQLYAPGCIVPLPRQKLWSGGVRIFDSFVSSFSDMFTDECRVTSFSGELLMSEACQVTADESC